MNVETSTPQGDTIARIAGQAPPLSDAMRTRLALLLKPTASVR